VGSCSHCFFLHTMAITSQLHTNQTGRFPTQSSKGMNYLMVAYDYDSNAILAEPLKNRPALELLRGYTAIHTTLVARGL